MIHHGTTLRAARQADGHQMVTDRAGVYGLGIESPNGDGPTREDRPRRDISTPSARSLTSSPGRALYGAPGRVHPNGARA